MIKKSFILFICVAMSGCAITESFVNRSTEVRSINNKIYGVLNTKGGTKVLPAVVSNPAPDCSKKLEVARLDKIPELQVYVDVTTGEVCK